MYIPMGLVGFVLGFTVRAPRSPVQGKERSEVSHRLKSSYAQGSEHTAKRHVVSTERQTSLDDLLSTYDSALYESIQRECRNESLARMICEVAATSPQYASSLIAELGDDAMQQLCADQLISSWIETDPIAAYEWFLNNEMLFDADQRVDYKRDIFSGLTEKNPAYAWELLGVSGDSSVRNEAAYGIAESWVRKDPEASFDWLESLGDSDVPMSVINDCYQIIMQNYLTVDPDRAAVAIGELESGALQQQLAGAVVQTFAEQDVGKAMDWLDGLESSVARDAGLYELVNNYVNQDPVLILDYIFSQSGGHEVDVDIITTALMSASEQQPELAAEQMNLIPEESLPAAVQSVAQSWLYQDEEAALSWIETQPPGVAWDAGAATAANYYLADQPDKAFEWACQIVDDQKRADVLMELTDLADRDKLELFYAAFQEAPLTTEEYGVLEAKLDTRIQNEFPTLVLP